VILRDAAKGKYTILPGSSTAGWYFAYGIGTSFNFVNPVMDYFLDEAQKKLDKKSAQVK
jgi:hypothetical protein